MDRPLRFYSQTMPPTDRNDSLERLAASLRAERFDVVGLCGIFEPDERDRLVGEVADLYRWRCDGPHERGLPIVDEELAGGGLLLLSRHHIASERATIYRQYSGEDGLVNKGVLHARIEPAGCACGIDLFLTQTQTPRPRVGGSVAAAHEAILGQVAHLSAFIDSCRDPMEPALLVGDLDVDPVSLKASLRGAQDLRPATRPIEALGFSGRLHEPAWKAERRDLSGRRGLELSLNTLTKRRPSVKAVRRAHVKLVSVRCLQPTSGPGDDEVSFELTATSGAISRSDLTGEFEDMAAGSERRSGLAPLVVEGLLGKLVVSCTGREHGHLSADEGLGGSVIVLEGDALASLNGAPLERVMPLLTGDGGEYALRIEISVE